MYIAVLCKGKNFPLSGRSNGDWASFISKSKPGAIEMAMQANEKWGGSYTVLVGELSEVVRPRREYYLKAL